ncbi:MAG: alkaline phosphatase D family protein [Verrucomicrobia bacterium]|nr:alkaline phosphatase D family protein [Verrucomicrobiota bacterium]
MTLLRKIFWMFVCLLFQVGGLQAATFHSQFPEYTRTWIGPDYWANRLQDWRVTMGRLECLNGESDKPLRTVHWLTGGIADNGEGFEVSVRTGTLGFATLADGSSYSGFLIGAGEGKLDYRGAALIHHDPGLGGGLLVVFNDKGQAQFIRNDEEGKNRTVLASGQNNSAETRTGALGNFEDYRLDLKVSREIDGKRELWLSVVDLFSGNVVSSTGIKNFPSEKLRGGLALVSHGGRANERRFWFRNWELSGEGIVKYPERSYGPVLGVIYSVDGNRLKLNAQFPPLGFNDSSHALLEIKRNGREWSQVGDALIEAPSFTALFDLELDGLNQGMDFRVGYLYEGEGVWFEGNIPVAPKKGEEVRVAGVTCYQNLARAADGSWGEGAAGSPEGRWTPHNVWFPHNQLISSLKRQDLDLLALLGDQIYEGGNPTGSDASEGNPHLDYLYKWFITLWDLGRITRVVPTVVLVDDHDVYQGDLWGDGGTASRNGQNKDGGYIHAPEFVRMVERTQTAANPEPLRREHIQQGLTSYYTDFEMGGVKFVLLEDRKFKSLPTLVGPVEKYGSKIANADYDGRQADIPNGQLLGAQQEAFLQSWIDRTEGVRIGFTQTLFASLHTAPSGKLWLDLDSGGWPQSGRNRALEVLAQGNVILLSGDTHLPAVLQHGVKGFGDSVWQFVVPSIANKYRRWWEPKEDGANRRSGEPYYTGDFFDGFGNRMTVAAVGNPHTSNQEMFEINVERNIGYASEHLLLDSQQTKDGYGMIVISPDRKQITLECWPTDSVNQHEGWPVILKQEPVSGKWVR